MPGFVKTSSDEKKWAKSKSIARNQLGSDASEDEIYSYANAVFHNIKDKKEESITVFDENKLDMYSNFNYLISNLKEEEIWHTMKEVLSEHPNFNVDLDESDQYLALEYLYKNYKEHINESDFNKIEEYLESMLVPNAKYIHDDHDIQYGVLEEDYISGGFGGLGSAEYGYGGVGYSGGRSRRRGFGGPRQGGQMSRRATGNPYRKNANNVEEPVVVNIPDEKSTYKPWQVELTPSGINKRNIQRNKVQNEIEDQWNSELGSTIRGLESAGLDMDDFDDMSQEEIENVMIKKLRDLGKEAESEMEQSQLQESLSGEESFNNIIKEAFTFDISTLEETLRQGSRIQDAREILATKHNYHKAIEKEKDRSYVIDQYGIDKLMRKFGYVYDENNFSWIKKAEAKAIDKSINNFKNKTSEYKSDTDDINNSISSKSEDEDTDFTDSEPSDSDSDEHDYEDYETEDFEKFKNIEDPVKLESKIKPLMARFILSIDKEDKTPSQFSMSENGVFVPKIDDEQITQMMNELKYDWESDKDIWVDDTNTLPSRVFVSGEDRKSLTGRSYLAAMGELPSIQFGSDDSPLFSPQEVEYRMKEAGFIWNGDINKWTYNKKDLTKGAESLKESVLYEAEKEKNTIKFPVNSIDQRENQARFLYRASVIETYKLSNAEMNDNIKEALEKSNYPADSSISINKIEKLLMYNNEKDDQQEDQPDDQQEDQPDDQQEDQPDDQQEDQPDETSYNNAMAAKKELEKELDENVREKILNVFYEEETDPNDEVEISGEEETDPNDEVEISGEEEKQEDQKNELELTKSNLIIPSNGYSWNKETLMWLQDGKDFPEVLKKIGESPQSFAGRPIVAELNNREDAIEIEDTGDPVISAEKIVTYLEDNDKIHWKENSDGSGMWIEGSPQDADPDALSWLGLKMKEQEQKLLSKFGQGYNKENLDIITLKNLQHAMIGNTLINSNAIDENDWYDFSNEVDENSDEKEIISAIKKGKSKQQQIKKKKFDEKYKVVEKEIPEEKRENPMKTHEMVIKKRKSLSQMARKAALGALWGITKKLSKWAGSTAGHLLKTGILAATSLDGYQGPYKFIPSFKQSAAWKQYQDQRKEKYYSSFLTGKTSSDTGTPSRPKKS